MLERGGKGFLTEKPFPEARAIRKGFFGLSLIFK